VKALLFALWVALAPQNTAPLVVDVVADNEGARCSILGSNVPVDRVVREIAERTGRELSGFEGVARAALVTVELKDRPIGEVLEVVLGSVGLRHELREGHLRVLRDDTSDREPATLRDQATAAYLLALQRFPSHPLGAAARLSQARMEIHRGNGTSALDHLRALVESYRTAPLVHDARIAAAGVLESLGRFAEAAAELRLVIGAAGAEHWHPKARLDLARNTLALGNPELAEAMLTTLERAHPTIDRGVIAAREFVRAEAYLELKRWIDALHAVERCAVRGLPVDAETQAMSIRARAFEGLDMVQEASRAWLIVASDERAPRRALAFERAASLALEAEEELSVLFVAQAAVSAGVDAEVDPAVFEARRRLGLPEDGLLMPVSMALTYAAELAATERWQELTPVLKRLHNERALLELAAFVELGRLRAEQTFALAGIAAALDVLRDTRWELERPEDRLALDRVAAALLERVRDYNGAVLAYEGVY